MGQQLHAELVLRPASSKPGTARHVLLNRYEPNELLECDDSVTQATPEQARP